MMKKLIFILFILFSVGTKVSGQKKIEIAHFSNRFSVNKLYNLDGLEIFLITNTDTLFIPKMNKYEFQTTNLLDSLAINEARIVFLIKSYNYVCSLKVDKEQYLKFYHFTFSLWINPEKQSFFSV